MSSEVTQQQVADPSQLVYGEGAQGRAKGASAIKMSRQTEVIAFFEGKEEELGIGDFHRFNCDNSNYTSNDWRY